MKKLLFWLALIVGTVVLIGSCAKEDDDSTTATTCVTDTTASGSITVGSETMSGVYVSECITTQFAAVAGTSVFPSDVKSGYTVIVVTGDTAFSDEILMYNDTSCSTPTAYIKNGRDNVTVGAASGNYYQVTHGTSTFKMKGYNEAAVTHLEDAMRANISTIDLTVNVEFSIDGGPDTYKNLWSVASTTFQKGEEDEDTQPTEMDSPTMTKSCQ